MTGINSVNIPILTTERVTLRQVSIDEQQGVVDLRSDTEINKYLDREPSTCIEDAINFIKKITVAINTNSSFYWVISLTDTKTFVGTICLYDFSNENNSCEIGYELLTKFQGQGLMKEAAQVVIDFVFQTLKLKKIVAFTHSENQNSTKLLTKFDFIKSIETNKENPKLIRYTLTQ